MVKKDDEFIKEWEEKRKKKKFNYFLTDNKYFIISFLSVVIISFLIAAIVSIYTEVKIFDLKLIKSTMLSIFLILILLIVYSYSKWKKNEIKYNRLTNKNSK